MSAWVMKDEEYTAVFDVIRSIYDSLSPIPRDGMPDLPFPSSLLTIQAMARLNYDSVYFRYSHNEDMVEPAKDPEWLGLNKKLTLQSRKRANCVFDSYAKASDWMDLIDFLRCWDYQSCEIPESQMNEEQKKIMKWADDWKNAIAMKQFKKSVGKHKTKWGEFHTADVYTQNKGSEVISLF